MSGVLDNTPFELAAQAQRVRILDAIVDSCAAKTFRGTTITDIVARASISRSTFYKHFIDKRACFDAAVEDGIEEVRAVARAARDPEDPPTVAVSKVGAAILRLLAEKPGLAQMLAGDAPTLEPGVVERYRQLAIPALAELWDGDGKHPRPHLDPKLALARAQLLVYSRIATGDEASLPELLPDVVYLAVAPFAGHEEGLRQAREARRGLGEEAGRQ